ncbi:MAG: transporter [Ignavibacteriae bacterium]|nr:transporter [Ignavibacteriota bacterium]MCB9244086.1 transporter [Ignavibacteriales bacterium]
MRGLILSISVLLLAQISLFAQANNPGDILPDRPDQTESPDILQPGFVQIEGGYTYTHIKYIPDDFIKFTFSVNEVGTLIRIGIFPSAELRIEPEYQSIKSTISFQNPVFDYRNEVSGFIPLRLGTKIKITDEDKYIPATAFLFKASIPEIASNDFQDELSTAEFRVALSKTLSERFSLGVNLGAEYGTYSNSTSGLYTMSFSGEIYKQLGGFIELYGYFSEGYEPNHFIDGGLTYRILNNLQVDLSAGTQYSDDVSDFFIGGGLSVRLPR